MKDVKKVFVLICLFLLCGCTATAEIDIQRQLDSIFLRSGESTRFPRNNETEYFSYYLPSDMRETGYDDMGVSMEYGDAKIFFNVNTAGIIGAKYYNVSMISDGFFSEKDRVYHHNGSYSDSDQILYPYTIDVYQKGDQYYLYFNSRNVEIYGVSLKGDLIETARHILVFARGAKVETDKVIQAFSHKGVIDYQKKQVDLFEKIVPANGVIGELIITDETNVPQDSENDVE